jgi:hypothetical protein
MDRAKKINLISVLLAVTALIMIALGFMVGMPAPAITGLGFLLLVWALQVLK